MNIQRNKLGLRKILFTAVTKVTLLFLLAGLNFVPVAFAKASLPNETTESGYTIKLSDAGKFGDLIAVAGQVRHLFPGSQSALFKNIYSFTSAKGLVNLQVLLAGDYVYLEPQKIMETSGVVVNDPGFSSDSQNIDKQWGLIKTGFDLAWQKSTGSPGNIVAVVDTGIDETHEDLKTISFVPGFNFVTQQGIPTGTNSDDNGHGTLVAGELGATANNGLGIVGTNWQISVMPIKALDSSGKGDATAVAQAIVWAADHGAQFVNLSLGGIGFGHDTTLANAIAYAFNKNVLIVAAAGNDTSVNGQSLDQNPVFPVCDDNNYNMVLGVAATDQNDLKPDFSNYGKNCIDVDAPGKRILSTISIDPLTKKSSPNSYAYASGTSMAVPFVVGQAALIKALYPSATNIQIRDRIIATADPIDDLNLSQCSGSSCRGLLGAGRINVPKSLQTAISQNFAEGDLIKVTDLNNALYKILGGQKRLVSPFVYNQRFSGDSIKNATASQLSGFPEGAYVTPKDGTLVKLDASPSVYVIQNGQKLPVTYQVFTQRNFKFSDINTLSYSEVDSWQTGNFYAPVEGTLLKTVKNKTVYWVVGQALHPINWNFFIDRGLNVFPIMIVPDNDITGYAAGEAYIR